MARPGLQVNHCLVGRSEYKGSVGKQYPRGFGSRPACRPAGRPASRQNLKESLRNPTNLTESVLQSASPGLINYRPFGRGCCFPTGWEKAGHLPKSFTKSIHKPMYNFVPPTMHRVH